MQSRRIVTILGALQVFLIVSGFFALGIFMKWNGWPDYDFLVWSDKTVALRRYGMWLLLVPMIWTGFALKFNDDPEKRKYVVCAGILICCVIVITFFTAIYDYRRPFLWLK